MDTTDYPLHEDDFDADGNVKPFMTGLDLLHSPLVGMLDDLDSSTSSVEYARELRRRASER